MPTLVDWARRARRTPTAQDGASPKIQRRAKVVVGWLVGWLLGCLVAWLEESGAKPDTDGADTGMLALDRNVE